MRCCSLLIALSLLLIPGAAWAETAEALPKGFFPLRSARASQPLVLVRRPELLPLRRKTALLPLSHLRTPMAASVRPGVPEMTTQEQANQILSIFSASE